MSTTSSSPGDPEHLPEDLELSFDLSQYLSPDQANFSKHISSSSSSINKTDDASSSTAVATSVSAPSMKNLVENWRDSCMIPTDKLGYILEREIWHDIKFLVGDPSTCAETLSAHKLILAMSSTVFEAMLFGPLSNSQDEIIEIPDVDPHAFGLMLKV